MTSCQTRPSRSWVVLIALLIVCCAANAQQPPNLPSARLLTVSPPGGKLGTTVDVGIGGSDLDEVSVLYFSHPGLKADRIPLPLFNGQFVPNRFKITIAPNTPLGVHDVRAIGKWGITNPRAFVVSELNHALEVEPNNDIPQGQKIELNSTVSGTIAPNVDVDYYAFAGKKGQRVVIACEASSIDSRLDPFLQVYDASGTRMLASNRRYSGRDAVLDLVIPADADYFVRLCEHTHQTGSPEHFYRLTVSLGPWIDGAFPPVVEAGKPAQVALYGRNLPNGQPDPETRIEGRISDKLAITVTPPADPQGLQRLTYSGTIEPGSAGLDGFEYRVKNAVATSNPILLTYASAPVILDTGDNDTPEKAQTIPLPAEVCGRIEKRRDRDFFTFTAKANEVYAIEAYADRLGSPLDLYLELRRIDEKGQKSMVGEFDDLQPNDVLSPTKFYTYTDDPKTRFTVPADGKYELMVSSRTADLEAGPRHIYRLSLRKEQPDFRLVAVDGHENQPEGCTVLQGGHRFFHVYCFRNDSFAGEVTLTMEGLPAGVTCAPQTLGPGLKQTALVVTAAAGAAPWAGEIKIKGTATVKDAAGKDVPLVREARAGCIVWPTQPQQNVPAISRLSRSICLAVRDKAPFILDPEAPEIAVPIGGTVTTKVKVNRQWPDFKGQVQLSAIAQPTPPNAPPPPPQLPVIATIAADKPDIEVKVPVPNTVLPGVYNLVFRGLANGVDFKKNPMDKQAVKVNVAEPCSPIKVTVYNSVADLSVGNPSVTIKGGVDQELVVRVARKFNYAGEFKVSLVLPQGFQGVSAAEVTIPANVNEGKLVLKCPANTAPAMNPNVTVRATAQVGMPPVTLTQEAKFAVTITK